MSNFYFKRTTGYYTKGGRYISTLSGPTLAQLAESQDQIYTAAYNQYQNVFRGRVLNSMNDMYLINQINIGSNTVMFNKFFQSDPQGVPFAHTFHKERLEVLINDYCKWQEIDGNVSLYDTRQYPNLSDCNVSELLHYETMSYKILSILYDFDIALRISCNIFIQVNKQFSDLFLEHFAIISEVHKIYKTLYIPDDVEFRCDNADDFFDDFIKFAPQDEKYLLTYASNIISMLFKNKKTYSHKPDVNVSPVKDRFYINYLEYIDRHHNDLQSTPKAILNFYISFSHKTRSGNDRLMEIYDMIEPQPYSISSQKYDGTKRYVTSMVDSPPCSLINCLNEVIATHISGRICHTHYQESYFKDYPLSLSFNPIATKLSLVDSNSINYIFEQPLTHPSIIIRTITSQPHLTHSEFVEFINHINPERNRWSHMFAGLLTLSDLITLKALTELQTNKINIFISYCGQLEGNYEPLELDKSVHVFHSKLSKEEIHNLWHLICSFDRTSPQYKVLARHSARFNLNIYFDNSPRFETA